MGALLPLRFFFIVGFVRILTGFRGVGSTSDRPLTPIPFGLYHSSDALLKEIKAMVVRHPDTLTSFGQHGKELVTTEVALQQLSVLAKERSMQSMDVMSLHKVLDNLVIKMVPMENLNGRKLVEAADRCERRNGRGVDLNRNWGVD